MHRNTLLRGWATRLVATTLAIGLVALVMAAGQGNNRSENYISIINAGQETPPVMDSAHQGVAYMQFDPRTGMLSYSISYDGLNTPEVAAHIHGPADAGEPAGVVFPLPVGNPKVGEIGPLTGQERNWLKRGLLYINIHSEGTPSGEIRGQVLRTH